MPAERPTRTDPDLRRFVTFCLAVAVVSVAKSMLTPLVPLYALHLGASPTLLGLIVSAGFWLPSLLAVGVGVWVDRIGARWPLLLGTLGVMVAPLAVAALGSLVALAAAQIVLGLAQLLVVLAAQSQIGAQADGRLRLRDYGWYSGFQSGGKFAGPLLAGIVADAFGFAAAFAVAGLVTLVSFVTFARTVSGRGRRVGEAPAVGGVPSEIVRLLGLAPIRLAVLASCGVVFALAVQTTFLPARLDALAFSVTSIGMLFSVKSLAATLVRPALRHVVDLHGGSQPWTLVSMTLALAVGVAIVGTAEPYALLLVAVVFGGIGSGISQPLSLALVAEHADPARRGLAIGVRLMGNRLAQVSSPVVIGVVIEWAGMSGGFLAAAVVLLVTAAAVARSAVRGRRRVPDEVRGGRT